MQIIAPIISLILIIFWIMRVDCVAAFSPIISASALKEKTFKFEMLILFLVALVLMGMGYLPTIHLTQYSHFSSTAVLIASIAAFISIIISNQVSKYSSIVYALLTSLLGVQYYIGGTFDFKQLLSLLISWMAAPLLAMIFSMIICTIYNSLIHRLNIHLFKLCAWLKYLVLFTIILLAVSLCINNGSVILFINSTIPDGYGIAFVAASVIVLFLLLNRTMIRRIYYLTDQEFDISLPVSITILLSSALVQLIFSFDTIPSHIGLSATPLSLPTLLFASMIGTGIVQKREIIEKELVLRNFASTLLLPIISIFVAYLLCSMVDINSLTSLRNAINPSDDIDLNLLFIIGIAAIGLVVLIIISYQERIKSNTHNITFSQQQMMYENQNELNALEMKTILAENQSLHNRLDEKRKELINVALKISEQKELTEGLYEKIRTITETQDEEEKNKKLDEVRQYLFQRMSFANEIDGFYAQAEILHKDFSAKLKEKFPNLTEQEKKLATLLRLGFSTKEIATLMNISVKSGEISRYRLRKKLNLSREDNLIRFIKSL